MTSFNATNIRTGDAGELKTALVTGATGLLGQAVSHALCGAGWRLALSGRDTEALDALARSLDGETATLPCDLAQPGAGTQLAAEAREALGAAHLLVHLASPPVAPASLLKTAPDFDRQMAVNATAFLELSAALLPDMLRTQTGILVPMLSRAMLPPAPTGWQAYTMAKAAQAQAAAEIAAAYGNAGIRVLGILPGLIAGEKGLPGAAPQTADGDLGTPVSAEHVARRMVTAIEDDTLASGTALSIGADGETRGFLHLSLARPAQGETDSPQASDRDRRLGEIIRELFKLPDEVELADAQLGVLPEWDSLGHIKLVMEIEAQFDVAFSAEESTEITSFAKISDALLRHGVQ